MKYLLDTHIMLWAFLDADNLSNKAREILSDTSNEFCYSIVSLWEVSIKHNKRPDDFTTTAKMLNDLCIESDMDFVDLNFSHVEALDDLIIPEKLKHEDPFDRMLLCQARVENMVLLTHDKKLSHYNYDCVQCV